MHPPLLKNNKRIHLSPSSLFQHNDTLTLTIHYPNTATYLLSSSTISSNCHTYLHHPQNRHKLKMIVNIYSYLSSLSTIPTQRHTHRHCPLSQHSDILTAHAALTQCSCFAHGLFTFAAFACFYFWKHSKETVLT